MRRMGASPVRTCARPRVAAAAVCIALLCVSGARAAFVDRVIAVVNNDVITLSDLRLAVAFNTAVGTKQNGRLLAVETLEGLVNRKLLLQEAYRLQFAEVTDAEVTTERERFRQRFGSDQAYQGFLARAGMTEEHLDRMLGERLVVERFVQRKIELYARVSREDVRSYYDEHRDAYADRQLSEVQAEIEALLSAQMAAQQLDAYVAELRTRADIRVNSLEERDGF